MILYYFVQKTRIDVIALDLIGGTFWQFEDSVSGAWADNAFRDINFSTRLRNSLLQVV